VPNITLPPLPGNLTVDSLVVLVIFAIAVAMLYRLFKVAFNTIIAAVAGAAFPWVVKFLKLGIPVTPSLESSLMWAGLAALLYLGYEFVHYLYWFIRLLTWPIRVILGIEKNRKFGQMRKELDEIKKQRQQESG
jgi:hypothetical protein